MWAYWLQYLYICPTLRGYITTYSILMKIIFFFVFLPRPGKRKSDDVLAVGRENSNHRNGTCTSGETDRIFFEIARRQQRRVLVYQVRGQQHSQSQQYQRVYAALARRQRLRRFVRFSIIF